MDKKWIWFAMLLVLPTVNAVCPLCTVAVGAGVGILRYFGIDDSITGIWIGALILSSALWFDDWLKKKGFESRLRKQIVIVFFYLIFLLPLYFGKIIGVENNTLFGIDKIIFGSFIGSIIFAFAVYSDNYLRKINDNRTVFPYQKVIIPIFYLILFSVILYLTLGII